MTSPWYLVLVLPSSDANAIMKIERTSWKRTTCTYVMSSQLNPTLPLPWGSLVLVHPRSKAHRHCDLGHHNAAYTVRCVHSETKGESDHYSHFFLVCYVH